MPESILRLRLSGGRRFRVRVQSQAPAPPSAPGTPGGFQAAALDANDAQLSWTAPTTGGAPTGYKVFRGGVQVATPAAGATSYTDPGLSPSTTYSYTLKATNAAGDGPAAGPASATTPAAGASPNAPTGLVATAGSDAVGPYVSLSWSWAQGSGGAATAFKVEASDCVATPGTAEGGASRWRPAMSVPGTQTSCKYYGCDAYPIGGRTLTWLFRVTAVNDSGFAGTRQTTAYAYSSPLTLPVPSRAAPGAPTRVTATAGAPVAAGLYGSGTAAGAPVNLSVLPADSTTLHLEWNQADDREVQFDVRYSTDNATWTTIPAATSSLVTRYFLTGLSPSTGYYVQVRAANEANPSAWADLAVGPTGSTPTPVATLAPGQVGTAIGYLPPAMWTMQRDWKIRQAYADYQASPTLNDAAKQFAQMLADANQYVAGHGNGQTNDYGFSVTGMFLATGLSAWAQAFWDNQFAPGVTKPYGVAGGVGPDVTITSVADATHWGTDLTSFFTPIAKDTRVYSARVQFLDTTPTVALRGKHVQVVNNDVAGNLTLGTPTVALPATPAVGDVFQLVPYCFYDVGNNYHSYAGHYLDAAMLLWGWFDATKKRQVTNMFNWWADTHIEVDQAGTYDGYNNNITSHDDVSTGALNTLAIDRCLPGNPLAGRWLDPANYGAGLRAPMTTSGSIESTGTTASTYGYADKASYLNTCNRQVLCGRGGRPIIGDQYDPGDARENVTNAEVFQFATGVDHFPLHRRLWADYCRQFVYSMAPDKSIILMLGDWQDTSNSSPYPTDRTIKQGNFIARFKQVAGAVRGHPNAAYAHKYLNEWLASVGYAFNYAEAHFVQDWYPALADWRADFPNALYCQGAGALYFHNGWGGGDGAYMLRGWAEPGLDHVHYQAFNFHLWRKGTFAFSEPVGYNGRLQEAAPLSNGPTHCGLGPMWVCGVEAADASSNAYAYICWATHGNYFPQANPPNSGLGYALVNKTMATPSQSNPTLHVDTFVLEQTRSAFVLPGDDGRSETVVFCDRMWDVNPKNLPNWGSTNGYGTFRYLANARTVGGVATGAVTAPPTAGAVTPTTTRFSTDYSAAPAASYRVEFRTGANAGYVGYLVATAASATVSAGGSGYRVGDVLTTRGTTGSPAWSVAQSGSSLPTGGTANPATWTVTSVGATGNVTGVALADPGAYLLTQAGTASGGSGTGCTLAVTYVPAWDAATKAMQVFPPLAQPPAAGDQLVVAFHLNNGFQVAYASTLRAQSWHAPRGASVSVAGTSASWTLPQDPTQAVALNVVSPATARIVVADESDIGNLNSYAGYYWWSTQFSDGEIGRQVEVRPDATDWPAGTTPVFNTIVTAIHCHDVGVAVADAPVASDGGEARGVLVSRPGLPDVLVLFGARKGYRVHQSGYSVTFTATTATSTVYLCDLDPSRAVGYTLDGGASTPLSPSAAGVASLAVSGAGQHTIALSVA